MSILVLSCTKLVLFASSAHVSGCTIVYLTQYVLVACMQCFVWKWPFRKLDQHADMFLKVEIDLICNIKPKFLYAF